ncbi:GAF domain-containing protein [Hymenobacter sp. BT664]|uniref:GAF domain-containing protein n=1 Tax=Hymenobacter montanus TaxID=2771359 RepID=A0A927BCH1_9BACT|nr:GAF domain-containing protein [Hymenobacter montanus]MBD2768260.1 GAF domain-containing protein [Hymenobacter montanus]
MSALFSSLIPADDASRLRALERYWLLDARSEKVLDDIVAATAQLFNVSNALLSFVEAQTVLVKAPYNLPIPLERIPREQSLCSATILQNEAAVYEDLDKITVPGLDPALVHQLGLHFYAGYSLRAPDGHNIGALCLFDGTPRRFSPEERTLLGALAGLVMRLLELRRLLGPHAGTTAMLWEFIYKAISEQLAHLTALARRVVPTAQPVPLDPALAREAGAIVGLIDSFVAGTLRRS